MRPKKYRKRPKKFMPNLKSALKNKKILALIAIPLILFVGFAAIGFNPFEEEDYLITWDWLVPDVADDTSDNLKHSVGGEDLKSFVSLGIYSSDITGIVFKSKATFGFEVNSYLGLTLESCYPNINPQAKKKFHYLEVGWTWGIIPQGVSNYYVTAHSVDLGGTFNDQYYIDPLQVSVDIVPVFKDFGGQYLNDVLINSIDHAYEIKTVQMDVVEHGLVGEYNDLYTSQDTQSGSVDVIKLEAGDPGNSAARQGINDLELGWETADNDVRNGITMQNHIWESDPVGETYHNSGTGPFNFNVGFGLRPEITYSEQTIHMRRASLLVDTLFNTYQVVGSVQNYDDTRMRSIHITSPFIHQEYEVSVYFLATVQLSAEEYESALEDPYFVSGDWLWNEEIGGTTDVTLTESDALKQMMDQILSWLAPFLIIAVIIVGIYIFMKIAYPIILYKMGKKAGQRKR